MYNLEINSERWLDLADFPHEKWKDIEGFKGLYQISNFGRVKSLKRKHVLKERILRARIDKKGYNHYALKKDSQTKECKAQRLVAEAFVPNPKNKTQVNHLDGNKINNYYKNLEWCTNSENQIHSYIITPYRKNIFRYDNPKKRKQYEI